VVTASADISEKIVLGMPRRRFAIRPVDESAAIAATVARRVASPASVPFVGMMGNNHCMDQQTMAPRADPRGTTRRRRGVAFWLGLVLLLAGLGLLGYVGWEFFGTNVVAHHKQQSAVHELQRTWRQEAQTGATAHGSGVELGSADALVRIPRFGKDYVMPVFEGVGEDVLAKGFGHFRRTAKAGAVGNYALAAHRITHGQPLRNMPELRPGDKVVVETRKAVYTYALDTNPNNLIVSFTNTWVLDPVPDNPVPGGVQPAQRPGQHLITLTTCSELFHTDNRMIAFGHLVATRRK
jgi:sortase A